MPPFSRLIRFIAKNGKTYYGEPILPNASAPTLDLRHATRARVYHDLSSPWGSARSPFFSDLVATDQVEDIKTLLCPLARHDIGTIRCLGLNYAKHAQETNMPQPSYPVLFYKPITAAGGPTDPIPISAMAREAPNVDYECELVLVIGKAGSDIRAADALEYIAGVCVGNDVSHREWQQKRGGGQWSLGKGFDGWAPLGPAVVSLDALRESTGKGPGELGIWTRVNGEVVQRSSTKDLIFGIKEIVSFLSRGTTLLPGDLIFTGTPEGVGMGRRPQMWLKEGDTVEVGLEGVGSCENKVVYTGGVNDREWRAKL